MLPNVFHMMAKKPISQIFIWHSGIRGRKFEASKWIMMENKKTSLGFFYIIHVFILRKIKYEVAGMILSI